MGLNLSLFKISLMLVAVVVCVMVGGGCEGGAEGGRGVCSVAV